MKNDIQDKQYIALELTKIAYPPILQSYGTSVQDIYKSYEYFLKQTMEITDDIETISSLKNEINKLRIENERFNADNQVVVKRLCEDIMNVLVGAKGDMEPYVYSSISNIIKAKIQ